MRLRSFAAASCATSADERFGALPRLALALRDADVDDDEHDGRGGLRDVAQPVRPFGHPRQIAADAGDDEHAHRGGQQTRQQDDRLRRQRQQDQRQAASPRERVDAHADRELDRAGSATAIDQAAPPAGVVESPDPEREIQRAERQQLRPRDRRASSRVRGVSAMSVKYAATTTATNVR